jgi:hypothetical protein
VEDPFIAVNADDYYGADAYGQIIAYLRQMDASDASKMAMIAYPITHTLSPNGTVNRGLCRVIDGQLKSVEEHTAIHSDDGGEITGLNLNAESVAIPRESLVSMNFWAFAPAFFGELDAYFNAFMEASGHLEQSECYLPTVVDAMIRAGFASCEVIPTSGDWFGVTYPEDKPLVQAKLLKL